MKRAKQILALSAAVCLAVLHISRQARAAGESMWPRASLRSPGKWSAY